LLSIEHMNRIDDAVLPSSTGLTGGAVRQLCHPGMPDMKSILLVDDEKTFLSSLSEGLSILLPGNFRIITAENGQKALGVLSSTPVSLVVTDLKMPVMDGFQLVFTMSERYADVPVVVISASINAEEVGRLHTLGVSQYLEKPLDMENLASVIMERSS
jgi:CheY-like chemotaxis protein